MNAKGWKIAVIVQTILVVVLSVALVFTGNGNRVLRQEKENLQDKYDNNQKLIDVKNKEIKKHVKIIADLKEDVVKWDSLLPKKNFINEENIISISSDFDSNIDFLSRYLYEIQQTDSLGGAVDSVDYPKLPAGEGRYIDSIQTNVLEGAYKKSDSSQSI